MARKRRSPYDPVTFVGESGKKWRTDPTGAHRPKSWKYSNKYFVRKGKREYGFSDKAVKVVGAAAGPPMIAAALSPFILAGGPHVWAGTAAALGAGAVAAGALYTKYEAQDKWAAGASKRSAIRGHKGGVVRTGTTKLYRSARTRQRAGVRAGRASGEAFNKAWKAEADRRNQGMVFADPAADKRVRKMVSRLMAGKYFTRKGKWQKGTGGRFIGSTMK